MYNLMGPAPFNRKVSLVAKNKRNEWKMVRWILEAFYS